MVKRGKAWGELCRREIKAPDKGAWTVIAGRSCMGKAPLEEAKSKRRTRVDWTDGGISFRGAPRERARSKRGTRVDGR